MPCYAPHRCFVSASPCPSCIALWLTQPQSDGLLAPALLAAERAGNAYLWGHFSACPSSKIRYQFRRLTFSGVGAFKSGRPSHVHALGMLARSFLLWLENAICIEPTSIPTGNGSRSSMTALDHPTRRRQKARSCSLQLADGRSGVLQTSLLRDLLFSALLCLLLLLLLAAIQFSSVQFSLQIDGMVVEGGQPTAITRLSFLLVLPYPALLCPTLSCWSYFAYPECLDALDG
jgi:hypothetical protein